MTTNQEPVAQDVQEPVAQDDKVSYATFKKLLDEKKTLAAQFNEMKAQMDSFKASQEEAALAKMAEAGEYQKLYEAEKAKATKAVELLEAHRREVQETEKKKAVLSKLGLKREEYAGFVDMDKVQMADGKVDEASLDAFVAEFKAQFPEFVVEQKAPPPTGNAPKVVGRPAAYDPKDPKAILEVFKNSRK